MCKISTSTIEKKVQIQDPFQVVKNYRAQQLRKRRKILRNFNKAKKVEQNKRYLLNSNLTKKNSERPIPIKKILHPDEEFNTFFEESANLPQQENYLRDNFFTCDIDFKEESDLFSISTVVEDKYSLYVQEFQKFEFNGTC